MPTRLGTGTCHLRRGRSSRKRGDGRERSVRREVQRLPEEPERRRTVQHSTTGTRPITYGRMARIRRNSPSVVSRARSAVVQAAVYLMLPAVPAAAVTDRSVGLACRAFGL